MSQNSFVQNYFEAFIDYIRKGKKLPNFVTF